MPSDISRRDIIKAALATGIMPISFGLTNRSFASNKIDTTSLLPAEIVLDVGIGMVNLYGDHYVLETVNSRYPEFLALKEKSSIAAIESAVRRDLNEKKFKCVAGWTVTETEAYLCALAVIQDSTDAN